jgi:Fur family ferric uptake transcriptional regulator
LSREKGFRSKRIFLTYLESAVIIKRIICANELKGETMKTRLTRLRKEILHLIEKAKKPLSVKIIKNRLVRKPNLSSIYRALEFLEKKNLIQRVSFSGISYYYKREEGQGHFLICKECNEMISFDDCIAENLQKKIQKEYGYKITDHVLYFEGLCTECRNYLHKKARVMD